jgi:hypothetical protein
MKVADRKRGLDAFPLIENALCAQENVGHAVGRSAFGRKVRDRFRRGQELDAPRHGELDHFVEAVAG